MNPTIDVVIPVYGHVQELRRCLESLSAQRTADGWIFVVDNGPEPSLGPVCAQYPGVVHLHQPLAGSYAARNLGIAHSTATHIAFTDADCVPAADWLERARTHLVEHPEARVLGGPVKVFPRDTRPNWVEAFEMATAFNVERYVRQEDFAVTANLVVERSVFDEVGLFRQDLFSQGDREWGNRAVGQGLRINYVPELLVRHPARRSVRSLCRKLMRLIDGRITLSGRQYPDLGEFVRRCRGLVPPLRGVWPFIVGTRAHEFSLCWRLRIATVYVADHYCRTLYGLWRAAGLSGGLR